MTKTKKNLTTDSINDLFKDYDHRVQDMLQCVVEDLCQQYKVIPNFFRITLELLSTQLDIYFKAKDAYKKGTSKDEGTPKKNAEYRHIQGAHDKIMAIMRELGMTSMSKKKLEKLANISSDSSIDELYDALIA